MRTAFIARPITLLLLALFLPASASAEMKSKEVTYQAGETTLKGFLAWDDASKAKRPGVLVVHEWWGNNEHSRAQAERLARAGYVGFALDMYGDGKATTHPSEAQTFAAEAMSDPEVTMARFAAARAVLAADPHVDATRLAAIGYCFGGAVVLAQARSGADLRAVASFHGALATAHPAQKGEVTAKVLVATGAADPFVPEAQVAAFEQEMKAAGADARVIRYPGAKHGFTNPGAASYGMEQLAYDKSADEKSWAEMLKLFKKALK